MSDKYKSMKNDDGNVEERQVDYQRPGVLETGIDTFFYLDPECRTEKLSRLGRVHATRYQNGLLQVHKAFFVRRM